MSHETLEVAPGAQVAEATPQVAAGARPAIGMLFAHLQLRAPGAQSFLIAPARSSVDVRAVARELATAAGAAGYGVRLVEVGGSSATRTADPGSAGASPAAASFFTLEDAREALVGHSGLTIACGGGLLDSPSAIMAAAVVDAVVVVARRGKTARADLEQVRVEVERAGGRVVGSLLQT